MACQWQLSPGSAHGVSSEVQNGVQSTAAGRGRLVALVPGSRAQRKMAALLAHLTQPFPLLQQQQQTAGNNIVSIAVNTCGSPPDAYPNIIYNIIHGMTPAYINMCTGSRYVTGICAHDNGMVLNSLQKRHLYGNTDRWNRREKINAAIPQLRFGIATA
ncbi:hypothetical protein Bbelb_108780 [Branchiostoma belcheri]|nr:hypothetical protein Bbelb_108780 [Branchiostoma belcheri]